MKEEWVISIPEEKRVNVQKKMFKVNFFKINEIHQTIHPWKTKHENIK